MSEPLVTLGELVDRRGLDPARTLVARHRPHEASLRKVFPFIVAEHRDLFLAYQSNQWKALEGAMKRAENFLSFVGLEAGRAVFAGAYQICGSKLIDADRFWSIEENQRLRDYGMTGLDADRTETLWFDLQETDFLAGHMGRLVIGWPGLERSWWRWANRNVFPVTALNEASRFEIPMPAWHDMVLSWAELSTLPDSWRHRISQWRGVYLITDLDRRAAYVGSAYGGDNILGRWRAYAASGHGGNKLLKTANPASLRFSILERTSPDLDAASVIRIESGWKDRLLTRQIGLNEN